MGGRRKSKIPSYFCDGRNKEKFTRFTVSLATSDAFRALTDKQRLLYVFMQLEHHQNNAEKRGILEGLTKEEKEEYKKEKYFVFNWAKVKKGNSLLDLYSNQASFRRDRDRLIEVGLIDCVIDGSLQKKKNLYAFSSRWHKYGTDEYRCPVSVKTKSMINKDKSLKVNGVKTE